MMQEFIRSLFLIIMAEMGDKTQILAMAFAVRYKVSDVLLGVLVGIFFNHGMAVLFGSTLAKLIPQSTIQIIAGFSFIGFALWTFQSDPEEEEENLKRNFAPIWTVAAAFFLGELGDKTQLAAITLSADSAYPAYVLAGTVTGMIAISSLGILVGSRLGTKVSQLAVKLVSGGIFLGFGFIKLRGVVGEKYMMIVLSLVFIILLFIMYVRIYRPYFQIKKKKALSLPDKEREDGVHENI